jgi:mannose-1-phosphate guanylyltransferase
MKAFILAAGNGTRLRPLTDTCPKCLLPIKGKPLLEIWLDNCHQAGITHALVNVHSLPNKIREFAAARRGGINLTIAEEPKLLGSAGTLAANRDFVANDEAFFILYGDVLTNVDLAAMLRFHRQKDATATLAIHQVEEPRHCGIVGTDGDDMVHSFVEKPQNPQSDWAFSGIMVATRAIFEKIPSHRPADIGFHLLPNLTGCMAAYRISEYLLDIGTLNNYTRAQSSWPGLG